MNPSNITKNRTLCMTKWGLAQKYKSGSTSGNLVTEFITQQITRNYLITSVGFVRHLIKLIPLKEYEHYKPGCERQCFDCCGDLTKAFPAKLGDRYPQPQASCGSLPRRLEFSWKLQGTGGGACRVNREPPHSLISQKEQCTLSKYGVYSEVGQLYPCTQQEL